MSLSPSFVLLLALGCNKDSDSNTGDSGVSDDCATTTFFLDADLDGFGGDRTLEACEAPLGYVTEATDCDDLDPFAYPGGEEVCDGADNDCDGLVDGVSVPADHATIQEAIDAVDDGALICVDAGTYTEVIDITSKAVQLEGAGAGATIVDAAGAYAPVLTIEGGDDSVVRGMTLTGSSYIAGGGLLVRTSEGVEISELEITGNDCRAYNCTGVGLYSWLSVVDLIDVDVVANTATQDDTSYAYNYIYGMVRFDSSDVVWSGGSIADNVSTTGSDTEFASNSYSYSYGSLYTYNSYLSITDVVVEGNESYITANSGSGYGYAYAFGQVYSTSSRIDFSNVDIRDNLQSAYAEGATYGYGNVIGGVYVNSGSLDWYGGSLSDNVSESWGEQGAFANVGQLSQASFGAWDVDIHRVLRRRQRLQTTACTTPTTAPTAWRTSWSRATRWSPRAPSTA